MALTLGLNGFPSETNVDASMGRLAGNDVDGDRARFQLETEGARKISCLFTLLGHVGEGLQEAEGTVGGFGRTRNGAQGEKGKKGDARRMMKGTRISKIKRYA